MTICLTACDHEASGISAQSVSSFLMSKCFGEHELIQKSSYCSSAGIKFKSFGDLSISEHSFGCEVQMQTPMMSDIYHLQVILSGESLVQCHGKTRHLKTGDALIVSPNSPLVSDYSADCRKLIIRIPVHFLMQTAREFGYRTTNESIVFEFEQQPLPTSGSFISLLNDILQQPQGSLCDRGLMYYSKLLANAIFGTFACNLSQGNGVQVSQNRLIERIREHVLSHITQDISIDELAEICHISRKSLYNLCDRELGMTPSAYVRCLKLESVHSELSQNDSIRNVTEVAMKYGFTNLGRFSAQYRDHIGELPSQTLRSIAC
ncbi:Exoenzyme S synthesis regulatory protein ExsA [Marinomonas aquimarina]|uniref:Exoenzyme S synthesis regulatory protein ExsA n=1 Tax=Marinomonas aquimarina TaxID=295068 RepID=A0A1A8TL18_9GAMM|nr:AraC family transcriptional regulator [Marinomonas aquimarina]SBS33443.1 Exoenzyme S synthesis regulatory protein ExsA [Marinomonas aquimarina]